MTAIVCPHCEAENRANAKFCSTCAKLMVNLDNGELLPSKKRRRRRIRTRELSKSSGLLRPATLTVAAGILLLGGAWWYFTQDARMATAHQAEATGSFQPHTSNAVRAAQASQPTEVTPGATEVVSDGGSTPVVFPNYVTVNEATQPAAAVKADAKPDTAKDAKADKAKADALKAKQAKDAARQRERIQKDTEALERVAEAHAPSPVAPAPAPAPRPNPEQSCAGQAFLSRATCMQKQCSQPGNASTPQCKRMFETQEALRRGSGGG